MSKEAVLSSRRSAGSRAIVSVFFLSALLTTAIPRLTWLFLFLIAIILIVTFLRRGGDWRQLIQPNLALIAVILAVLYAMLSVIWAADRKAALGETSLLLAVVLAASAAINALATLDKQELRRAGLAFVIGALLGALFLLVELATDGAITRMAMNVITVLQPNRPKHVRILQGKVTKINLSQLNRNVAMVMFNLWPGLLILSAIERGRRAITFIGVFFLAVAVPVAISEHDSSQIALIGSPLVFSLAWFRRRVTVRALAALWCVAFVLVLPLDFLAFKADLHMATWLPSSARARIILWEYTAERVFDHPWLGIGAASTPSLNKPRGVAEQPKGFVFPRTTGQHAHDLFLQTWFELGVVGVILIAFAGAALALRISLLPIEAQPFAAATFATLATIAAFSWSIWQEWQVCAVGLLTIYLALATRIVDFARG